MIKEIMQPELLQSCLQRDADESGLYGLKMGSYVCECDDHDLYSSISTLEDSSMVSSDSYFQTMLQSDFRRSSSLDDDIQVVFPMENISQHAEEIDGISSTSLEDVLRWWGESEEFDNISILDYTMENEGVCDSMENIINSSDASIMFQPIMLPPEGMEVEGQTSLCHLLKAYGEAMEMGQIELANVIIGCINEKSSPHGGTMERVAFNLFQSGNQVDYIKHESMKNFNSAFKAFYEIFPYGRFTHFVANSAILEAIMSNSLKVHIIDFDIGEGVQWPCLLEAIGKLRKDTKLTSIRTNGQSCIFEETRNQLLDFARGCGLRLEVQEMTIEDLVLEVEGSHEHDQFLAFNCMVGLPHMGRTRNRHEVMEFVRVAKQSLLKNNGIITFGDGEVLERMKYCDGYSSFFDECITHYHSLYESMEGNILQNLTEARMALESLFVAPYVSSISWQQNWENIKAYFGFEKNLGLMGYRMSEESLKEAKAVVKEGQSSYKIKVEGENKNEMVLEWRGTPLVRVSAWK